MFRLIQPNDYSTKEETAAMNSPRYSRLILTAVPLGALLLISGCEELTKNTKSILLPNFQRSDLFGFVAGLGTTFAVLPDLIAMLRRRSTEGMNPRMAAIIGCFQILWIYYGILIVSRPVVLWNLIGVCINFFTVFAYRHFARKEKLASELRG
jgi:uncharacterized protein with PQ loop repeat